MFAYLLTCTFVAVATLAILSRTAAGRPRTHDWPVWIRISLAVLAGVGWPLLSLWAVGHVLSQGIAIVCRWILGDHNKVRTRIDLPPSGSMAASGDGLPGWVVGTYDGGGRMRTDKR